MQPMLYKVEQVYSKQWQVVRVDAEPHVRMRVVVECPTRDAAEAAARLLKQDK